MNHFLVQGYVSGFTGGDFNNYKKGGIYLFERANGQQFNNAPPTDKGILEVIPSNNFVVQRATAIGSVNSSTGVTGAQYLRSASVSVVSNVTTYTWGSWITVSNTGGTISIADSVTPTDHTSAVTGYAVAQYVAEQVQMPHDPYVWLELSVDQDLEFTDAILHFTGWTNPVPSTVADLTDDGDFNITFKNTVPLVVANQFMGQCLALAPNDWTSEIYIYLPNSGVWNNEYIDGVAGFLTYQNNEWHLGQLRTLIPFWYYEVQDARDYTTERTTFTRTNDQPTVSVGGITTEDHLNDLSIQQILNKMLFPYVPPTLSSISSNISITSPTKYEVHSTQSLTYVKPTYSPGSESLTSIKVGTTSRGSEIAQSSTVPASGSNFTFTAYNVSRATAGNFNIYVTIDDGTTEDGHNPVKSLSIPFVKFYYYALSTDGTVVPNSPSKIANGVNSVTVTTTYGQYLYLYTYDSSHTKIQQYAMNQWNDVPTTSMGTKSLSIYGVSEIYYVFRTPALVAGSGQFRMA